MGGLKNRHLFPTVLEAKKSNIELLTSLVFGQGSLLVLYMFALIIHPYMEERNKVKVYRDAFLICCLISSVIQLDHKFTFLTSFKCDYFLRHSISKYSHSAG